MPITIEAINGSSVFVKHGMPILMNIANSITATRRTGREMERNTKAIITNTARSTSMSSILISAFCFFAATFGVGLYSDIDMISSLCSLMARGALISMVVVNCVLPSMLLLFDRVVIKTSYNFLSGRNTADKKAGKRNKSKENQLA